MLKKIITSKNKINKKTSPHEESLLKIYLKEINKIPLLTLEEETAQALLACQGDEAAKAKLVKANLRFVVKIAKKYVRPGIPLLDLISEGNMGLLKAIERFEPDRGYHFISYAVWWIRQAIILAINSGYSTIRLPMNKVGAIQKIQRFHTSVQNKNGREPTVEEIAQEFAMNEQKVKELKLMHAQFSQSINSLEGQFNLEEGMNWEDVIFDKEAATIDSSLNNSEIFDNIKRAAGSSLKKMEKRVLELRFGIDLNSGKYTKEHSLAEAGAELKKSRERIRQIEAKALKRLRRDRYVRGLFNYILGE